MTDEPEQHDTRITVVVVDDHAVVRGGLTQLLAGVADLSVVGTAADGAEALGKIREHAPDPRAAPLAGNSIATDRGFLARDMPELDAHLHYRIVDVSSLKELARRWYPRAYFNAPAKTGGHRALGDIVDSIAELRYYREAVFVAPPGPDSVTARTLASRHVVGGANGTPTDTPTDTPTSVQTEATAGP